MVSGWTLNLCLAVSCAGSVMKGVCARAPRHVETTLTRTENNLCINRGLRFFAIISLIINKIGSEDKKTNPMKISATLVFWSLLFSVNTRSLLAQAQKGAQGHQSC